MLTIFILTVLLLLMKTIQSNFTKADYPFFLKKERSRRLIQLSLFYTKTETINIRQKKRSNYIL